MRTLRPVGHHGLLVECDDLQDVMALHRALAADRPRGVIDLVPAARTVLLTFGPPTSLAELAAVVSAVPPSGEHRARPAGADREGEALLNRRWRRDRPRDRRRGHR